MAALMKNDVPLDLSGITLVVGLGKSGLSAVRALVGLNANLVVVDSRLEPPGLGELRRDFTGVPVHLGGFPAGPFAAASRLIVSPGVSVDVPAIAMARERGVPVWGDIELFARLARAPVAAITGSNGKSTVTTMLGAMAARAGVTAAVGGNLGTPALDLLARRPAPELFVLELSSFQLETTSSLDARVAAVLNISADHMDRYAKLDDYAEAKRRIFRGRGSMVINADDFRVVAMARPDREILRFTLAEPADGEFGLRRRDGRVWLAYGLDCWIAGAELRVSGAHNLANALAALAMGHCLGLDRDSMIAALREFRGLPHRGEQVAEQAGVRWINDSKGTNVGATLATLNGAAGRLVLIAGGDGKGQDFSSLRPPVATKARAVVLIGRDAPVVAAALNGVVPVHFAGDMEEAVAIAARLAHPGDDVLLSPACASFDMFRDYEARGEAFRAAVREVALC
jgi:UDP-N-acetylmuramoylalanine--D-glutamate ligase